MGGEGGSHRMVAAAVGPSGTAVLLLLRAVELAVDLVTLQLRGQAHHLRCQLDLLASQGQALGALALLPGHHQRITAANERRLRQQGWQGRVRYSEQPTMAYGVEFAV